VPTPSSPPRPRAALSTRARSRRRTRGQSLTEFALAFPLTLVVLLGIVEFGFAFNAVLAINYASRNAALVAAEGGDGEGTDCLILRAVESDVTAPADRQRIGRVEVYLADRNGATIGNPTVYERGTGSTTCSFAGGTSVTVPYRLLADGYPVVDRCNTLAGCANGRSLDLVGVRISYTHVWLTPLREFVGGHPGGLSFDRSNATRMEPVL
jgi:Flp pilus assembly protein TadG